MDLTFSKSITLDNGQAVTLRYPTQDDVSRLMAFINPIIIERARILLDEIVKIDVEREYLFDFLEKMKKNNAVKIFAVVDENIVGAADIQRQPHKQKHVGTFGLSVSKPFRNLGLGKSLMQEALLQAKEVLGLRMVTLTVYAKNDVARDLYKKLGFLEYGHLLGAVLQDDVYEDEILMYKPL
ncbi:MAG: GNAT family N-acetyltransferase [Candidatus Pacebacteria bacterium]|nr:GNAT family N-acetyltransferase [Candidatus Paceibacterota bacterium]